MDGYHLSQYLFASTTLLSLQIAVAHENNRIPLQVVDAMQDIMLRLDLCQYYRAYREVGG